MSKIIKLTETDLHNIIKETINSLLNGKLEFIGTCVEMDAEDVQYITKYDEYCENEYNIQDEYFDEGIIEIVPNDIMLNNIVGERPKNEEIDYCAYNNEINVGWIYTINDVHYFYE